MKLSEIFSVLEREIAPASLSAEYCEKYGMHDNSGVIIDCGELVNGVLFSLDFSPSAVREAKLAGYNLIVTHHPAIFRGVSRINVPEDSFSACLAECLRGGISVISMHLNFDCAPRGIDYHLMRGLGGEREEAVMDMLPHGGYGRVFAVGEKSFEEFADGVRSVFSTERCRFYAAGGRVKKVASFCGAGADERAAAFAVKNGADTVVSADMKHHIVTALLDAGINVADMTHYASEFYGFARIYAAIKQKLGIASALFTDGRLL